MSKSSLTDWHKFTLPVVQVSIFLVNLWFADGKPQVFQLNKYWQKPCTYTFTNYCLNHFTKNWKWLIKMRGRSRELVAPLVRASVSSVCRAERYRFEPQSTRDFLSVHTIYLVLNEFAFLLCMHISSSIPYITFGWHILLFQTQHRISNETRLHSLQDDRKRQALAGWPRKGRRKYRKRAWQRTVHLVEECEPDLRSAPRSVEQCMHTCGRLATRLDPPRQLTK